MLGLFFSLIGIGLVIGIITLPFLCLFVILRGRKEFSCLSCGMLSRRYPPLSMGVGFRLRCGYCGQKTLIPSNSPTAQQVMAGSVTPPVTPFVPPAPRPQRSKNALYLLLIIGIPAAIWLIIYAANAPTSVPTTPDATTAEPAQPKPIEVEVGKDGAVLCPTLSNYDGYRTNFAMWWKYRDSDSGDADEEVAALKNEEAIDAEENGCSTVPSGTPMTLENKFQEADDPDPNDAVASVTMRASDGTTVRGFTEADSLNEQ